MGVWNSGRCAHRITIEGCWSLSLDVLAIMRPVVAAMRRNATIEPFTLRPRVLSWSHNGEPYAEIEYTLTISPRPPTAGCACATATCMGTATGRRTISPR